MIYKILGRTKLKVSQIGFGAIQFARVARQQSITLVRQAHELGVNFIDTAHMYPHSEELLGQAISGIRDSLVISSKSLSTDKKEFLQQLDTSLSRLGTDYLDIFMFHDVSKQEKLEKLLANGVVDALIKQKSQGKVRHIGFSCHSSEIIEQYYQLPDFSVIMMPANFVAVEFTRDKIYRRLVDNNIGILGMKPMGGGRLEDAGLCLKYLKQYDRIVPVVGMESLDQVKQNIEHMENPETLDEQDWEKIAQIREKLGDKFCRGCRYCMPCPQGIDIYELNFLKVVYDQFPLKEYLTPQRTQEVDKLKECTQCRSCEDKCPYSLDILDMMRENRDFYYQKLKKFGYQ
ncbi:MAG: aldo/keto reductase [Actinomycetota bacterium]|nr:aldo/keto reductase [Actinomycetota bacterium]